MIYLTLLARRPGRPQPAIGWSCVGSTPGGRSLSDERRLGEGAKARVSESCPDAPRSTRRAEASGERVLRMGLAAVAQQLLALPAARRWPDRSIRIGCGGRGAERESRLSVARPF